MDPITTQNQQKEEKTVPGTKVQKPRMNLEGFARKDNENILDYISRVGQENTEIYNQNVDRYTIRLRPEEYAEINDLINVDEDKEAQSYKIASAMKYSKMYGIPLDEAYRNLDNFNYALYGKDLEKKSQKDIYHTVVDMLTLGQNTVDIGMIGGQLREANDRGDTEAAARLTELYRKYQAQNEFLQKNLPQNLAMKIVEAGAQSLPFTLGAIGMSIVSPVTGFTYSAGVMAGGEYLDILDMGGSHETAKSVSTVAGVLEGVVENTLGNVAGALGARAAGTKASEVLRRNVIDKVTKNVAEKMHYSGGWRIVANVLMRAGAENLEEGAEEAVQETISLVSKHIVKELDGLDIPGMTPQEIAADLTENFVGGLYGSILLGSGTFISNSIAAKADYDAVKKAAGIIPSEEAFSKAVSENPAFVEMNEETKAKAIHEVYQNFGRQRDEALKTSAEDIAESISADEENEVFDVQYDEDGNEIEVEEVTPEVRDDNGKLYSQYDTVEETADGLYTGKKVYGDATKENQNRYGYISYTVDEEAGTVTIDEFKTSKARQNLRNEMYNDFAADFANYDIVWNPKGNSAIQSKAEIERINPEGGLNYYKNGKQADAETRVKIAQELRANLNNRTVTNEMIAPLVAEFEALGNTFGLNVTDFYSNQFNGQIFGDAQEAKDAALSQGKGPIRGGIALNKADTIKGLRAVIYAAENADFSTFSHELAHMGRRMAELEGGKLAEEMNRAFNIGEDGWTVAKEEEFAEGFENYLHTGEAKTPGLKELFQKLAEFLARTFHQLNDKIKLSDDVKKVYDQLLSGDESVLRMAEDAVSNLNAEPTNNVAENVSSQETTETTENITKSGENLTENGEALSDEEIKTLVSDFTNEELKTLTDAGLITEETAQAVQETKLDDVTQAAVASILDDPEIPQEKKVEAVMKANGESYRIKQENIERYQARTDLTEEEKKAAIDDILNNRTTGGDGSGMPYSMLNAGKDMLFQIIGKKGAQALDEANEETIRMDNQRIAEEMEAAGKDAKTIRLATGWEKGADGQWKYEIDDSEYEIQDNSFYPGYNVPTLTEEQSEKLESLRTKLKNNNWNYDVFNEEEKNIFDKLTDEENFFANSIIEYDNGNFKWKKFVELQNVLKADELYKAYPMLKYVKFKVEKLGSGKAATFYPSINAIKIDKDYGSKVALIHEIQHAIQRIEGFANGSSIETLTQNYRSKIFDRMNEAYKAYHSDEKLKLDFDEYRRIFNKVAAASNDDFMTFYDELFKFEDSHENVKSFLKGLEQARKDLNLQFDYEAAPLFNGKITDTYYDRSYQEIEDKLVKDYYNFQALDDYKKIAGEVEARNVEERYGMTMEERRAQLLEETEDVPRNDQIVLFQTAYHGSGADFDKFDTDTYGLSGEGSMSFGYGTYVSGSEAIARDYALRQRPEGELDVNYKGREANYTERNAYIRLDQNNFNVEEAIKAIEDDIDWGKAKLSVTNNKEWWTDYIKEDERQIALLKDPDFNIKDFTASDTKSKLYTVEIPDDGYLQWDKNVSPEIVEEILKKSPYLYTLRNLLNNYEQYKDNPYATYLYGSNVYKALSKELRGGDKAASHFLYNMGFKGIEYPAGTIHGNGEGARNFVIFNDDDARITNKILFQNLIDEGVLNEAAGFESWVEFKEFCETMGLDGVPEEASSDWYLNTWEVAHNVSPTTAEREAQLAAEREEQREEARRDPVMVDAEWLTYIQKEGNLETFLKLTNQAMGITEEELKSYDAEERAFFLNEQDKINSVLSHPTINSARKRLLNHDELTPAHRDRVLKLFKNRARDYRAIFADVTGQEKWSVEQSESLDAELAIRARRFNLIKYDSEVENMTPEQKRRLENLITDKEVLKKFREDKVKMDDPDVEHYVEMLESQVKKIEKELGEARREFQNDMEMLGNLQARDIIRQYEEFLNLKGEADFKKVALPAGSKNAERIGEKAKRERQAGIRENYNSLAAKWETFKEEVEAKVKLQERLRAEGKISELEEKIRAEYDAKRMKTMLTKTESLNAMKNEYAQKKAEQAAARQLKEMRKTLVKRVMRRVNFNSIDYNQAKQIIAIQKVFEPNLRGGINKWIGTENKLAREIWSSWHTDFEAQKNMLRRLEAKGKHELVTLLENTKTEEDFEKWTKKERSALERAMPRQDWIKELNLDAWKDERDNALQLDIKEIETTRQVTQPDGTKKTVPYTRIEMSRDVQDMLLNALGPDMAYAIENRHFEDWITGEMEELAKKINKLFKDGRDLLQAKKEAEIRDADRIRNLIRDAIRTTGIQINDDDPEDVKKKKQAKIDKILGVHHELPGTAASANEKQQSWIDRILHGYHDANVRRVARILDNYAEGTATELLYFRENDCFNRKARAIDRRNAKIDAVVDANKLDMRKLGNTVKFYGFTFTVDELLMLKAAQMNQMDYYQEQLKDNPELEYEHALKESAYQAVMYGNLITPEEREEFRRIDEEIVQKELERKDKLDAATLAGDKDLIALYSQIPADMVDISGNIEKKGTSKLKALAESRMNGLLSQFNDTINEFMPLIEAIRADYAAEFDNINRVSIEEFNAPVWREKWYLPLVRLTAAGETHEQRLKQDLLGHSAGTGKAGTEKGFTKKRNEIGPMNQNPVELGLYKTWADSVERNEHFVAYAGYIRELNRVFFSKDAVGTMQELENRYGKAMKDYIDVYVKEVAAPQRVEPRKELDKVFHMLRGNTAPAYLGWKFSSILKQGIESPAPFMQFINPVEYTRAALQIASTKEIRESIEAKSAFMKSRVFDPLVDLINENVEKSLNKPSYGLKKFQQKGMEGLEWIDWACVAPGWLAIYDKEYRRLQETEQARYEARLSELEEQNASRFGQFHLTEEQLQQQAHDDVTQDIEAAAVLKADDCVRLCQPSNRNVDLAPMFKNNSEAAKAVLQFQTALNVIWQNIRYDIPYAVRNKEYKQIVGMILGYVMAGIMSGVVCQGIIKDDDEPEDTAKKLGYYATTQFLDSFPIVGGKLDSLAEKAITGEGGGLMGNSIWPTFDKYYNAARALVSEDYEKALNNVTQGLALTLGLPLSGAKEAGRALGIGDGDGELELNPLALTGQRE